MKKIIIGIIILAILSGVGMYGYNTWWKDSKDPVIATVGSEKIRQSQFDARIQSFPPNVQPQLTLPQNREKVLDQIIDETIIIQNAKKLKLDEDKSYQQKIQDTQNQLLISMMLKRDIQEKTKIQDSDLQAYYNQNKAQFTSTEMRRVSHILVKTEDEANEALQLLKDGANFEELAKERSIDSSRANGGDIGWFSKGQLTEPAFESATFALNSPNQISAPVKTNLGYHIIKLAAVTQRPAIPFEQAKSQIYQMVYSQKQKAALDQYLGALKKSIQVKKFTQKITVITPAKAQGPSEDDAALD